jgi:hypothetical protein
MAEFTAIIDPTTEDARDMDDQQRREFHEALIEAGNFDDLLGVAGGNLEGRAKPAEATGHQRR